MSLNQWIAAAAASACLAAAPAAAQQKIALPAKDKPLTLNARTIFQVGAVEGEDYETFAGVNDLAFDAKGNLYVLDGSAHRVIVFDAAGKFVRMFGREGGGPGEFGFPSALAVLPSGELVVTDGGRQALQVFDAATGEFLRSVAVESELGRAVGRLRNAPGGGLITETVPSIRRDGNSLMNGTFQMPPRSVSAITLGTDSASGRRLYNTPPREMKVSHQGSSGGGTVRFAMTMSAFEPGLFWAPTADGGVAVSSTEHYRIVLSDNQGRPARYLERDIQPRPVTDADKKKWLANRRNGATQATTAAMFTVRSSGGSGTRTPAPATTQRITGADIKDADVNWGDVIPVITALNVDSWGRLWVQRSNEEQTDGPIDLIDANGTYLGTLPDQQMPRAFGPDGRTAFITRDDLDVQRIVVKQVTK